MVTQAIGFSNPADIELLDSAREIARRNGRPVEAIVSEALRTYIAQNGERSNVRPEVMEYYRASVDRNRLLYELLADS